MGTLHEVSCKSRACRAAYSDRGSQQGARQNADTTIGKWSHKSSFAGRKSRKRFRKINGPLPLDARSEKGLKAWIECEVGLVAALDKILLVSLRQSDIPP